MPRKLELTFQKGSDGRVGRWKKYYRGKTHYLGSGRSRSDTEAYQAAFGRWQKLKVQLDADAIQTPDPLTNEYNEVISEWELVLSWAVQHAEDDEAVLAREKLAALRLRRDQPKPPPVTHSDRLWSRFRLDDEVIREIGSLADTPSNTDWQTAFRDALSRYPHSEPFTRFDSTSQLDGFDSFRRAEVVWEDRIDNQRRQSEHDETLSLGGWVKIFLARQQQRVDADELTAGRFTTIKAILDHFRDWAGADTLVSKISGQTLTQFHAYQLGLIAAQSCAPTYARDRMTGVKSFIRFLWGQDAIKDLPKNIDSKELHVGRRTTTPETLTLAEVTELLTHSTGRTRLYILLGLNCGMTQKDISALAASDISWTEGTVTRKRSKTRKYAGVPTVTYRLWPETLALLKEFQSDSELLLLNRNGGPLVEEHLNSNGKYRKSDNIKNAYERVLRRVSFTKSFKLLRKTSATLINAEDRHRGLDELFLGHAPSTVAGKHYSATSKSALDDALDFLRAKYGIESVVGALDDCS